MHAPDLSRGGVLTPAQRRTLLNILAQSLPNTAVWLFGSRATGRARPFSDLDLLVAPLEPLTWEARAAVRDAFEASDLPFRVDIVDLRDLSPVIRDRVEREKLLLVDP